LSPSAINAAVPIDTASAPSARHFATSAPLRMPPDTISCTLRCMPSSCRAFTGITTQDPELAKRLDPVLAGKRLANYLRVLTLEAQTIARACGKSHVHNLEPEDLVALTIESAAMAGVPLAGTDWVPGRGGM
jgi:hypothetical protein